MPTYNGFPNSPPANPAYVTIGSFDGVHRGHQALLAAMTEAAHAAGAQSGVLTFDPHPIAVLRPDVPLSYLTTPAERAELIEALGADFTLVLPFSRATAATSAGDFMRALVEHLNLRELWAGPDFALGRGREGNVERLAELGTQMGYTVRVAPPFDLNGEPVRSSRVRGLLAETGDVERAAELLGRPYAVTGEVASGARRGRQLGYPTANVAVPTGRQVPANGIYACWAWLEGQGFPAAVSIGTRPTFDSGQRTVEAYLLDFNGDLYGQTLGLSFISRLRPELRFPDAAALVAQMDNDVQRTRAILSTPRDDAGDSARAAWEELPHTADWSIRVYAESQRQLFARAAAAMYELQDADMDRPTVLARAFSVRAANASELLVSFLNHLLLDQELTGEMYTRFEIDEISDRGLKGVAYGYRGTPTHTAIKAVTYYDLDVRYNAGGWQATVTFDV
jgi:riboflavin kinase / FMN adenylyltransferase